MSRTIDWLVAYQTYLIPLVIYLAINISKREALVTNANPTVRYVARLVEKVLFLEWSRWGGTFKFLLKDDDGK